MVNFVPGHRLHSRNMENITLQFVKFVVLFILFHRKMGREDDSSVSDGDLRRGLFDMGVRA